MLQGQHLFNATAVRTAVPTQATASIRAIMQVVAAGRRHFGSTLRYILLLRLVYSQKQSQTCTLSAAKEKAWTRPVARPDPPHS